MNNFKIIENGDVTKPIKNGLICHIVNDSRKMGSGVALALLRKWPRVRNEYMNWDNSTFCLGNIQIVWEEKDLAIINMIAQHGIITDNALTPPIRYDAFSNCLKKVYMISKREGLDVHMPFAIGACRAGGKIEIIHEIIKKELLDNNIIVYLYKF